MTTFDIAVLQIIARQVWLAAAASGEWAHASPQEYYWGNFSRHDGDGLRERHKQKV